MGALHLPKQRGHIIMKFFILAALAALAAADPLVERYHAKEFSTFMNKFGKSYATSEESKLRFDIFKANLQKMHAHNSRKDVSWKMGINQFSDLTDEEFEAVHLAATSRHPCPPSAQPPSRVRTRSTSRTFPSLSTGVTRAPVPLSRIRDLVDPAGPSPLPLSLNLTCRSPLEACPLCPPSK